MLVDPVEAVAVAVVPAAEWAGDAVDLAVALPVEAAEHRAATSPAMDEKILALTALAARDLAEEAAAGWVVDAVGAAAWAVVDAAVPAEAWEVVVADAVEVAA